MGKVYLALVWFAIFSLWGALSVAGEDASEDDSSKTLTVTSLETTTFAKGSFSIVGMAWINDNIYILRDYVFEGNPTHVEVYDSTSKVWKSNITVNYVFEARAVSMAGSEKCNLLYIPDRWGSMVTTLYLSESEAASSSTWKSCKGPDTVSIANDGCNVIVTCTGDTTINEYTPQGSLVRVISLPKQFWQDLWQTAVLPNGRFVIGRFKVTDAPHGVGIRLICVVDAEPDESDAEGIKYIGTMTTCHDESLTEPKELSTFFAVDKYGSVIAVYYESGIVILLDSSLKYVKDLVEPTRYPYEGVFFDEEHSRLYVGTYNRLEVYVVNYE